ncbi:hypothetical protein NMY22_g17835 [Coprinellus aureogranulatus]|nr:hypothetical protein NMY22_g17835 [Coprinellus aureogranulatus]
MRAFHSLLLGLTSLVTLAQGLQYRGADFSSLINVENNGIRYKDNGTTLPFETILKNRGCNLARIRIWTSTRYNEYSLEYGLALAKRAAAAGMDIYVDLHYSDTWADPGKQAIPSAWPKDLAGLNTKIYEYTRDVVLAFQNQGTPAKYIELGNEINGGMLWPVGRVSNNNYSNLSELLHSATAGVRAASTSVKTMIHLANGWNYGSVNGFFSGVYMPGKLATADVDVLAFSLYPFYGTGATLSALNSSLTQMANRYGKEIMVVETDWPAVCSGVTLSERGIPVSAAGQLQWVNQVKSIVNALPNGRGTGVLYWEPGWIGNANLGSGCSDALLVDGSGNVRTSINHSVEHTLLQTMSEAMWTGPQGRRLFALCAGAGFVGLWAMDKMINKTEMKSAKRAANLQQQYMRTGESDPVVQQRGLTDVDGRPVALKHNLQGDRATAHSWMIALDDEVHKVNDILTKDDMKETEFAEFMMDDGEPSCRIIARQDVTSLPRFETLVSNDPHHKRAHCGERSVDTTSKVPIADDLKDILADLLQAVRIASAAFTSRGKCRYPPPFDPPIPRTDPFIVVDKDGVVGAWCLPGALSTRLQRVAEDAMRRLAGADPKMYREGICLLACAGLWGHNEHPEPNDYCLRAPQLAVEFLERMTPVLCVLNSISCIMSPSQFMHGRELHYTLAESTTVRNRQLMLDLMQHWPLPFRHLQINDGRPVPVHRHIGRYPFGVDLLATFGNYHGGVFDLETVGVNSLYGPGAVVGIMGALFPHAVSPVDGERFAIMQCLDPTLLDSVLKLSGQQPAVPVLGIMREMPKRLTDLFESGRPAGSPAGRDVAVYTIPIHQHTVPLTMDVEDDDEVRGEDEEEGNNDDAEADEENDEDDEDGDDDSEGLEARSIDEEDDSDDSAIESDSDSDHGSSEYTPDD